MKFGALSFFVLAALLSVSEALPKKNHGNNGGSTTPSGSDSGSGSGTGNAGDYQAARAKAGDFIAWDDATCDSEPGNKDKYGCCNLPSSPEFAKGWHVEVLAPLDDFCLSADNASEDLTFSWRIVPGSEKPETNTALFAMYRINGTSHNLFKTQISYRTPLCLGNGEARSHSFSHDRLQRFDPNPYKRSGQWGSTFVALPQTEEDQEILKSFTPDYIKDDVGGAWLARDCARLARQIKEGRVAAPPNNRFAIEARKGAVPGQASANDDQD